MGRDSMLREYSLRDLGIAVRGLRLAILCIVMCLDLCFINNCISSSLVRPLMF